MTLIEDILKRSGGLPPTGEIIVSTAEAAGVRFSVKDGCPSLKAPPERREEAVELARWLSESWRESVLEALRLRAMEPRPCPGQGRCPGGIEPACAGGPDPEIELLWPTGGVTLQWCSGGPDAGAVAWRRRGDSAWRSLVPAPVTGKAKAS